MTRRLSIVALLASALTACQLGGETTRSSPSDACLPVGAACTSDAGCCSFGCDGVCVANPLPGGMCRTTDDCGYAQAGTYPYYTSTKMTCKAGACTTQNVCRDDADVCTYDDQCCAGNCMGSGHCGPNHAPVIDLGPDRSVPYHKTVTLTPVTASDPDGDALNYGWTLQKPSNSLATLLPSATASVPYFTPDVEGVYTVTVVVNDGVAPRPNRMTASSTVNIVATNTPPVATIAIGVANGSRNVNRPVTGTAVDPDGDALLCKWTAVDPTGATRAEFSTAYAQCGSPSSAVATSFTPDIKGGWTLSLTVTDGSSAPDHVVTASATYLCVNDPPVANPGPTRYANAGAPGGIAPTIPVVGSGSDVNGDTPLAYAWSLAAVPAVQAPATGDSRPVGEPLGETATIGFTPQVMGTYTLKLRVTDPDGDFDEKTVDVNVGPYIKDLGHDVKAAAYAVAKDRLVLAGTDTTDGTKGRIWIVNPQTGEPDVTSAALTGVPTMVASSRDATIVAAAAPTAFWWSTVTWPTSGATTMTLGSSIASSLTLPFRLGDIELSQKRLYLLNESTSSYTTSYVYAFDTQNATQQPASTGAAGVRASVYEPASGSQLLYVWDPVWSRITKYSVNGSGQASASLGSTAYGSGNACGDLWAAESGDAVFTGCGTVLSSSTFSTLATLGIQPTWLHTAFDGRSVALTSGATALRSYTAMYGAGTQDTLPVWGYDGNKNDTTGQFAFLSSNGNTRYVIVTVNGKTGLVTFP